MPYDQIVTIIRSCNKKACGHDRSSHYRDVRGEGNCLARGCDCQRFEEDVRETLPPPKPEHY